MCGPSIVDENLKNKIAAYGAKFRQVSRSPFGDEDQIGMLNLMSPESMRQVMSQVDGGMVFDLGVDLFIEMPAWTSLTGDPPFQIWMSHTPSGQVANDTAGVGREQNELVAYSGDCISMYTHSGTHLDSLNHFGYRGELWNGFTAAKHLGSRHWTMCGADKQPPIIARGVLFDVAGLHGVDILPDSYGIGEEDLRNALKKQGTEFRPGDVAMIWTGRMGRWPNGDLYQMNEPGLNLEGAEFLAKSGAIMIGADNAALEQMPTADPENWMTVHTYLFAEAGVPLMEIVNLTELAENKVYEFAFLGACLKIRGATAGPMRPLAMPLRKD